MNGQFSVYPIIQSTAGRQGRLEKNVAAPRWFGRKNDTTAGRQGRLEKKRLFGRENDKTAGRQGRFGHVFKAVMQKES